MTPPDAPSSPALPHSYQQAALRGLRCKCPRCGEAKLFRRWLKPIDRCPACAQDWSIQRADDFPAYIAIFVTGHLMAPLILLLAVDMKLSPGMVAGISMPLAAIIMVAVLQPAKGAVIATQWWHGLVGFTRERPPEPDGSGLA